MNTKESLALGVLGDNSRLSEPVAMLLNRPAKLSKAGVALAPRVIAQRMAFEVASVKAVPPGAHAEPKLDINVRVHMDPEQINKMPQPGAVWTGFGYTSGVFEAVEQLGLKLESKKEPVEVLIIDRAEKPEAN